MNCYSKTRQISRSHQLSALVPFGLLVMLTLSGCSDASGYVSPTTLVDVMGEVTLDGKPLENATLHFVPTQTTSGTGGFAVTNSDGHFDAQHYSLAYGLEPGSYDVTFSRLLMEDGNPIPPDKDAADVGAIESLPPHLVQIHPNQHPFRITVDAAPQDATFELASKWKR